VLPQCRLARGVQAPLWGRSCLKLVAGAPFEKSTLSERAVFDYSGTEGRETPEIRNGDAFFTQPLRDAVVPRAAP